MIVRRLWLLLGLSGLMTGGCAQSQPELATFGEGTAGTYSLSIFSKDSSGAWKRAADGVLVLTHGRLPNRVRRTLESVEGDESVTPERPSLGEACFRWSAAVGNARSLATVHRAGATRWRRVRGDSLHLLLFTTIDASYQVFLGPARGTTLSGRGDPYVFRLASEPGPPADSVVIERLGEPNALRCLAVER
jgi:hypothetical protein